MEVFLVNQTTECQKHRKHVEELERTLQHQRRILTEKSIPKIYTPKQLQTSNNQLTEKFMQDYGDLFFQHLNKVIESNTISLELHKAALNSVIMQTEQKLVSSQLQTDEKVKRYYEFMSDNNIQEHIPIPALQVLINQNKTTPPQTEQRKRKRHQKRKRQDPHPIANKTPKQDHSPTDKNHQTMNTPAPFLGQRHHHPNHPP